ncbi:hypothetical protein V7654_05120 [Bacillus sp. JJ1609]|uniref:F510_1955 family glycosylhydrolase n=1 Tax=Bacillus sp. JJ1609 TaxID=3122977 RepID=UPI002FFF5416
MKSLRGIISIYLFTLFVITGCGGTKSDNSVDEYPFFRENTEMQFQKIHGLGYVLNQNELYFGTDHGLVKYVDNKWYSTTKNNHDYIGFQAAAAGFYASGHPEPGTQWKNPLGIIKSIDKGKSFQKLAFYGESNFEYLAAGYLSDILYVVNENSNSKLDFGIYYSIDQGESWKESKLDGFHANSINMIAAHPKRLNTVGISTDKGLYLSLNNGDHFDKVTEEINVSAVQFEEHSLLYFSIGEETANLFRMDLFSHKKTEIELPASVSIHNPVTLVASNPKNREEITVVTSKNDIYQTHTHGIKWKTLAKNGENQ